MWCLLLSISRTALHYTTSLMCILTPVRPLTPADLGPLGECPHESPLGLTDSQCTPLRSRRDKDTEEDKLVIAKLWTEFQAQALKNISTPDPSLAPTDGLYPPLPCGTTALPPMSTLSKDPVRPPAVQDKAQCLSSALKGDYVVYVTLTPLSSSNSHLTATQIEPTAPSLTCCQPYSYSALSYLFKCPHTAHKNTQHVVEIEMQRMVICHDLNRRLTEILEGAGTGAGTGAGGTGLLGMHGDAGMCSPTLLRLLCSPFLTSTLLCSALISAV